MLISDRIIGIEAAAGWPDRTHGFGYAYLLSCDRSAAMPDGGFVRSEQFVHELAIAFADGRTALRE